ncbi:MAG TPA: hypothetical protein VF857_00695 [Spirochaetota bacterium]
MEELKKYITELAIQSQNHQLAKKSEMTLQDTCSPFEGIPQKHPQDKGKILLYSNPFDDSAPYYEFPVSSIGRIDEIETVSAEDGKSGIKIRLWIKKGTKGILSRTVNVG